MKQECVTLFPQNYLVKVIIFSPLITLFCGVHWYGFWGGEWMETRVQILALTDIRESQLIQTELSLDRTNIVESN